MAEDSSSQRITRLTPLSAILALVESRVEPVQPQKRDLARALGCTLAEDVVVQTLPQSSIALRDGFAVEAAAVADASSYAPVPLSSQPPRVDTGETMPADADAVLPLDAIVLRGGRAEAVATVAGGEGVLPAGGDAGPRAVLRSAGNRLRGIDIAIMRAAGIAEVTIRTPRISVVRGAAANTPLIDEACALLARAVADAGGEVVGEARILVASLDYEKPDAVIAIGGTGTGRRDDSVQTAARYGRIEAHGIAISPGETAAFGFVGMRPVLLVPGRLDAALALWLLIGRHLVAKPAGGTIDDAPNVLPLKRKVTSTIGLVEVIPITRSGGMAELLASGYLSFTALARSDGWIVIPADSEGFAAGTLVAIHPWP